jgi:hypothetical protein
MAVASGMGLRNIRPWGWSLAMVVWGALVPNCAMILDQLFGGGPAGILEGNLFLIPRILFYVLSLGICPYGIWAGLGNSGQGRPSRIVLIACLTSGLVVSAGGTWLLIKMSS